VATEDSPQTGNGKDQSASDSSARSPKSDERLPRARRAGQAAPAVNGIEASRKPRRQQSELAAAPAAEVASPPAVSPLDASPLQRADTDPWTVPQSVRDRFVQDGHRFYFPDGKAAFRDLGRKLTTGSENTQVVRSLIEIAHSRGWTEVTVTGTERFRQEAWRQARLEGLAVRGFRPTDEQQAQLVRALARNLARQGDAISAPTDPVPAPQQAPREPAAPDRAQEQVTGKLIDHGRDAYRHDPNEDPSYFVRLQTRDGAREIWGKDVERAIAKSLTQPQIGDEIVLRRTGRDAVTVKRQERDAQGQLAAKEVEAYRNRWVIEKREFFEQRAAAAQLVRDESIAARDAVRQHPELTGTYLNLRAAELASRALREPVDQRRFVAQVRGALADGIERGDALQPVRFRSRTVAPQRIEERVRS
jgi:Large polyvalent protein-associated domain 7